MLTVDGGGRYFRPEEDPRARVSSNFMNNFLEVYRQLVFTDGGGDANKFGRGAIDQTPFTWSILVGIVNALIHFPIPSAGVYPLQLK